MPDAIAAIASRHKLSPSAVQALAESLARGNGAGAQWSHPDLGGMGQWLRGGMLQIGEMFNHELKSRVAAAIADLLAIDADRGRDAVGPTSAMAAGAGSSAWWPNAFGHPSSTGAQNGMRYACFPDARRLVVSRDGRITVYDTGSHRLTGFSQAQGEAQVLAFSGPDGRVTLDDLTIVG